MCTIRYFVKNPLYPFTVFRLRRSLSLSIAVATTTRRCTPNALSRDRIHRLPRRQSRRLDQVAGALLLLRIPTTTTSRARQQQARRDGMRPRFSQGRHQARLSRNSATATNTTTTTTTPIVIGSARKLRGHLVNSHDGQSKVHGRSCQKGCLLRQQSGAAQVVLRLVAFGRARAVVKGDTVHDNEAHGRSGGRALVQQDGQGVHDGCLCGRIVHAVNVNALQNTVGCKGGRQVGRGLLLLLVVGSDSGGCLLFAPSRVNVIDQGQTHLVAAFGGKASFGIHVNGFALDAAVHGRQCGIDGQLHALSQYGRYEYMYIYTYKYMYVGVPVVGSERILKEIEQMGERGDRIPAVRGPCTHSGRIASILLLQKQRATSKLHAYRTHCVLPAPGTPAISVSSPRATPPSSN